MKSKTIMDTISELFKLFGFGEKNRLGIERGDKFMSINDPNNYVLEFNGMMNDKMEFLILNKEYKNIGGCVYSEDDFEILLNNKYKKLPFEDEI
jgi:hypothetical protein